MTLIPSQFLDAVVSIHAVADPNTNSPETAAIATGFLYGHPTGKKGEDGEPRYRLFFVTNRHVFEDSEGKSREQLFLRFNKGDEDTHTFGMRLIKDDGTPLWSKHGDERIDLAIVSVSARQLGEQNIRFHAFHGDEIVPATEFANRNISTGDGLFILGFPMGISGEARKFAIVRYGVIARVDEELLAEGFYYIDASAYPGNSGGPVIVKPEVVTLEGTKANNMAGLIGVVSAGITYQEVAVSQQTGEPRVVFTEQSGLVRVVPVERIIEVVERIVAAGKTEEAPVESEQEKPASNPAAENST